MYNDVYICDYVRTPIGRYGGVLSSIRTDDLAALPIKALLERNASLDKVCDEVVLGCANQAGEDNRNIARMASLLAGLPASVPGITVNRLCASGMDAVLHAARTISLGEAQVVIAGGVESMSRAPFVVPKADTAFTRSVAIEDTTIGWRLINPLMRELYGVDSMPETAENVAAERDVSRADQDAFALRSQQRAAAAKEKLAEEIIPVPVPQRKGEPISISADEHPRETSLEALAKLPTPFRDNGTVTAGNSSGVNDGAAALIIACKQAVEQNGWQSLAKIVAGANGGVEPRVMGVGPEIAVAKLCHQLDCQVTDFDLIELNEAFAAQAIAVLRKLGIPEDAAQVNPNGGAIALGHPLGMSGARLVGTAARHMQRDQAQKALATMCVGVGQGVAIALES